MEGLAGTQVTVAYQGARVAVLNQDVECEETLDATTDDDHIQVGVRPVCVQHAQDYPGRRASPWRPGSHRFGRRGTISDSLRPSASRLHVTYQP